MRSVPPIGSSAAAGLAVLVALLVCSCGAAEAATGEPGGDRVAFGAYVPEAVEHPQRLDAFARLVGRKPAIVSYYKQWDSAPFVPAELDAVWERGAVPMVTWEPLSYSGKNYPLRQIQRGRFDRYIRKSARAAARWGHPILVRISYHPRWRTTTGERVWPLPLWDAHKKHVRSKIANVKNTGGRDAGSSTTALLPHSMPTAIARPLQQSSPGTSKRPERTRPPPISTAPQAIGRGASTQMPKRSRTTDQRSPSAILTRHR